MHNPTYIHFATYGEKRKGEELNVQSLWKQEAAGIVGNI